MVINLRGTNGSGKSTAVVGVLQRLGYVPLGGGQGKQRSLLEEGIPPANGYVTRKGDVVVVGSYHNECGGCDGIKTQDEVCARVIEAASAGHNVLFEGVIVGTIFGRYLDLSKRLQRDRHMYVWAFMDTPYAVCVERIQKRNQGKPVREDQVRSKFDGMSRIAAKARAAGERVVAINHTRATDELLRLMGLL